MGETYQALYRKWRPKLFADIVGQNHVSETLKTAISTGRIAHAYLFCGTRGTGKTSTAKIFSRGVNCENPQNGEPCNECDTCKGILNGSILDVYEMDAASNGGVDNIREIRDDVIYASAGCKFKVYIIDEVHMLSNAAFNALLKTLEEPPSHALFILATTEPNKIPATVLSRCQRFDFKRIGVDEISCRLRMIAEAENIGATVDALELIAELGDGSMRDSLSLLDQCAAFNYTELTSKVVAEIIGIADPTVLFDLVSYVIAGNTQNALEKLMEHLSMGKEVQSFLEELILHYRNLLLCKAVDNPAELLEKSEDMTLKYTQQSKDISTEHILYAIRILSESVVQAKTMTTPSLAAETAIVKLCTPSFSTDTDALLVRIEKLERMLRDGVAIQPTTFVTEKPEEKPVESNDEPPWETEAPLEAPQAEQAPPVEDTPSVPQESSSVQWDLWGDALAEIKRESKSLFAFLYGGKAFLCGNTVEIELNNSIAYDRIAKPEGLSYLSKLFSRVSGTSLEAKAFLEGQRVAKLEENQNSIFDLANKKDMLGDKINIIE